MSHLLSLNVKTVNTYCLQTAKPSTPTVFKRQNCHTYCLQTAKLSRLLSSNGKTVAPTVFKRQNRQAYRLQTAKLSHLLSSNGKTVTPTVFKRQNCHTYNFQVTQSSTSTVFKWQYRTTLRPMSSNGKAIDTYSLQMAMT